MGNDLVTPEDLLHFPGAPFLDQEVDAAVADVRSAAEWHIAPLRTQTVTLDVGAYERRLRLPTRHLVAVVAIRNADTDAVISPSLYRVSLRLGQVMRKGGYWPAGFGAVEVDMTHGYTSTPLDLLAVVAEAANMARRDQAVRSVHIDDFQSSYGPTAAASGPLSASETLNRYALDGDPLYGLGIA